MQFTRSRQAVFLAIVSCFDPSVHAADIDGAEVLQQLVDYDSIFESNFTVASTRQSVDHIIRGSLMINATRRWVITFGGERVGYEMEIIDYEKPKYQLPEGGSVGDTLSIPIRTRQWGYWGQDLSGNHYEDTVYAITPEGEMTETGKMQNSSIFGPRDDGPIAPRRVALWSLGRFFSSQLSEVTEVSESTGGRLLVSAVGKKGELQNGRWELEIEPDAAWMVRKAKFYLDRKPDRVNVEMSNSGTTWSGAFCIPEEAAVNHWGPIGDGAYGTERLVFDSVVQEFDEQLYGRSQKAVADNETPTLAIHDYRVSPPAITEPFRPKPSQARRPLTPKLGRGMVVWFVLGNAVVLAVLFALSIIYRKRAHSEESPEK